MTKFDIKPTIEKTQDKLKKDLTHKKMNSVLAEVAILTEIY